MCSNMKRKKTIVSKYKRISLNVLGGGLSFLAFLSCFAVGFSSWISNTLNKDDANINVSIGNIENNNIFTIKVVNMFGLKFKIKLK